MNKKELLKELDIIINKESNPTYKGRLKTFKRLINKSNLQDFTSLKNSKGIINLGYVAEDLVLNYLGLKKEDNEHEIKSLICNSWNTLTNNNVNTVYILVCCNSRHIKNGLYKVNANEIFEKRGTIQTLKNCKSLKYLCSITKVIEA